MRELVMSKRRTWAIATATALVVALVTAVALIQRAGGDEAGVIFVAAQVDLARIDDLGAAAEARVTLASLRANLIDPPTSARNGPHARRLSQVLAANLERGGIRADSWTEMSELFAAVRQELQLGDPAAQARAQMIELETALRTYAP